MSAAKETCYTDVASWELSNSLWARIEPLLPKVQSRYRGRGKKRKHIGGRPLADRRKVNSDAPSAAVAEAHGYILHVPDKANAKKNASASRGGAKPDAGSLKSRTHG